MPKLVESVPKYRLHRASGQAVVTIQGKDFYLGPWKSKASRVEYDRLIGEWLAGGRHLPQREAAAITVTEVAVAYLRFAEGYYVTPQGKPTGALDRVKAVLRTLREMYGRTPAAEFGPLALQAIQGRLAAAGKSRSYVNDVAGGIKRVFKWAVAQQLIPPAVHQALTAVPGLRRGRTQARETAPIGPVADAVIEATLPHLPPIVADMARLQRLTGCRPGEVCDLRPQDLDRSGEVWTYKPAHHKTEHHGRTRTIFIGPRAQAILLPYLLRAPDAYCFCPAESENRHNAERRAARRSPMTPSQAKRRRKRRPATAPGACYSTNTYRQAITRAVELANRARKADEEQVPRWAPNRLRHTAATEIRSRFGLEATQVILGHARADVTQVYAERDMQKGAAVALAVG